MKTQSTESSSPTFSEFIRNASCAEKKAVYSAVITDATEAQRRVIKQASATPSK